LAREGAGQSRRLSSRRGGRAYLQGIKLLEELKIRPWQAEGHLLAGELYADTGQKQKALSSLMKAQGMFQEMEMTHWLFRTQRCWTDWQV